MDVWKGVWMVVMLGEPMEKSLVKVTVVTMVSEVEILMEKTMVQLMD